MPKNPVTREFIPIWVADYILGSYGTGAIMSILAHYSRDHEFAEKYNTPIVQVVTPNGDTHSNDKPYTGNDDLLVNSSSSQLD